MKSIWYPKRIISDRGLAFTSREFKKLAAEKVIRHALYATPSIEGGSLIGVLATSAETDRMRKYLTFFAVVADLGEG